MEEESEGCEGFSVVAKANSVLSFMIVTATAGSQSK